jgi:hypothetical protein
VFYERKSNLTFILEILLSNVKMLHQRMRNIIRSCLKTKVCGERDRAHYKSTSMNTLRTGENQIKAQKKLLEKQKEILF